MQPSVRFLALAAALSAACSQIIPSELSRVTVIQPLGLQEYFTQNGGIHHNEALFGIPLYGGSVSGAVIDTASTACTPLTPTPAWGNLPILLVDRGGGCTFEEKVYWAQVAGASGVLVADTSLLCNDPNAGVCNALCTQYCRGMGYIPPSVGNPDNCECFLPYMGDDNSHDVTIPSFLISNDAATHIRSCLAGIAPCNGTGPVTVSVELVWPLPSPDNRVEWAIWTTPIDPVADTLRVGFQPLVAPLGAAVQFTGHSFIYDGQDWGCVSTVPNGPCGNQCMDYGRYCSPDPDGNLYSGHTGQDVVWEELRQLCIFQQANETVATDFGIRYWNYVNLWYTNCVGVVDWPGCSATQQTAAMLSPSQTDACMTASAGANGMNSVLQPEMKLRENYFIITLPTFVVNEQVIRGKPTPLSVLQTICNGFASSVPTVCECTAVTSDWLTVCAQQGINNVPTAAGGRKSASTPGMASWAVALIAILIIAVVGVIVAGVVAYRKAHQNMQTMLDDYRKLEAEEVDDNSRL